MTCNLCSGRGVRQVAPPRPPPETSEERAARRQRGEPFLSETGVTRALWPWALCSCVVDELGALRTALVSGGLLPREHWTRGLPARSEPPELSFVVLSTRRDGYRIVSRAHPGPGVAAREPDGRALRDEEDLPLLWNSIDEAERWIDHNYPLAESDT
jgi:hypothetical protein